MKIHSLRLLQKITSRIKILLIKSFRAQIFMQVGEGDRRVFSVKVVGLREIQIPRINQI